MNDIDPGVVAAAPASSENVLDDDIVWPTLSFIPKVKLVWGGIGTVYSEAVSLKIYTEDGDRNLRAIAARHLRLHHKSSAVLDWSYTMQVLGWISEKKVLEPTNTASNKMRKRPVSTDCRRRAEQIMANPLKTLLCVNNYHFNSLRESPFNSVWINIISILCDKAYF